MPSLALPLQPGKPKGSSEVAVTIHRVPEYEGFVVQVRPPATIAPSTALKDGGAPSSKRAPVDIVLVIDVSGSMASGAPVPVESDQEAVENGLCVLDLVKHAAHTILETLGPADRLGVVTFSQTSQTLLRLCYMNDEKKALAKTKIDSMQPDGLTNLWHGILDGIKLFQDNTDSSNVPAIMLLTDGLPNYLQGIINKMRASDAPFPAPIHTFGFGYELESGLLKSVSELTGGNYAFIPDAGMLGTVFVHAVANLQSTFATNATLDLIYPKWLALEQTNGGAVGDTAPTVDKATSTTKLTIRLNSLQLAEPRHVYLRCPLKDSVNTVAGNDDSVFTAVLKFRKMSPKLHYASGQISLSKAALVEEEGRAPALSEAEAAFIVSRSEICAFLAGLSPLNDMAEHQPLNFSSNLEKSLGALLLRLPAASPLFAEDKACAALVADIKGQISMALSVEQTYYRWGQHYLPSLQSAHTSQQCNSFRDPGPLLYGSESRVFKACRDALDKAFDTLPPPPPSRTLVDKYTVPISMTQYRQAAGPCFASFCRVMLADNRRVCVNKLHRGMRVVTPRGPRAVAAILKTPVSGNPMIAVGRLLISAWHPISHNAKTWLFPVHAPSARPGQPIRYTGAIYSILLQPDKDVDAHALNVEGIWVATLGHGLTPKQKCEVGEEEEETDVRVHRFFGDYAAVCRSMATMDIRKNGVVLNGGSARSNWRHWHTRK